MDWVCNDAWRGPFTQTIFSIGALFGCLIFGFLSDKFGRYPTFLVTNVINLVFGIIISYCHNYTSFITVRFFSGLSYPIFFNSLQILGKSNAMFLGTTRQLWMLLFSFQPLNMSQLREDTSLGMWAWQLATA